MNIFEKLTNYLKETKQELRHVNWPTRQNTIRFTALVIASALVLAIFLGAIDFGLQLLLDKFVF